MKPIAKIAAIAGLATIMFAGAASAHDYYGYGYAPYHHYHGPYCYW